MEHRAQARDGTTAAERRYAQDVAVRSWQQGLAIATIAKQDGVGAQAISDLITRWGIPRRTGRQGRRPLVPELPDKPVTRRPPHGQSVSEGSSF